ncbi:hypothetical protein FACS1894219_05630 [Clostridia bacterium]|nr:hypothetical protein FACS1894219_05630 [Clostridia bacterium]
MAPVYKNGKCGFINTKGDVVIPYIYDSVHWFCEGYAAVKKGGKWGFIDDTANIVIPFEYDDVISIPTKTVLLW